jgi:hypothetical protein
MSAIHATSSRRTFCATPQPNEILQISNVEHPMMNFERDRGKLRHPFVIRNSLFDIQYSPMMVEAGYWI